MTERHSFITEGISRRAFQDLAVKQTSLPENEDLYWYLHNHIHDPYGQVQCNDRCQVVRKGKVEIVTRTDVARSSNGT